MSYLPQHVRQSIPLCRALALASSLALTAVAAAHAQPAANDRLALLEEQAMQAAVARVAPSIVRIETIGGLERVGELLLGTGPTTGLVVSEDGLIVSSSFNFVQRPASIVVTLPTGEKLAARVVAHDRSRMLTLLKVAAHSPLSIPEAVPADELRVGQWSIAVGRTFNIEQPSLSVGIVSALDRIWGKALQTDAKISPMNYGGPLVDIHGRVLGILVPLSPTATSEVAGTEWYDSGIGFAVPLEHFLQILPRLRQGQDLLPGLAGISLKDDDAGRPVIAAARVNSPAAKAGLQAGDRVIEAAGAPILRQAELKTQLNQFYAGDSIPLAVDRAGQRIDVSVELAAELVPYTRPFLGILPAPSADASQPGVALRHIFPASPAALAKLTTDDRIVSVEGTPVHSAEALRTAIATFAPGTPITLTASRNDASRDLQVVLAPPSDTVPAELPPTERPNEEAQPARPTVGSQTLEVGEFARACHLYVPDDYDPRRPCALLVLLHPPASPPTDEWLAPWYANCARSSTILVVPTAAEAGRWTPADLDFIRKSVDEVTSRYQIDPTRVAVYGQAAGGSLAFALAFEHRDLIRGVAALDTPLLSRPPDNDPVHPLAFYIASSTGTTLSDQITATVGRLRDSQFPVTQSSLGPDSRPLNQDERQSLFRWIDALDRI